METAPWDESLFCGGGNASNIRQVCVFRNGTRVADFARCGFRPDDAVHVASVTKGVMALLAGIALDRGALDSLDRRVLDFFPGYAPKRGEKTAQLVTVRHLLTMTAPWKGRSEPWKKVCTSPDWTRAALDFLGGRKGLAGEFRYATLGLQLLTGVLEAATGERLLDFANECLFSPLGIPPVRPHGDGSKEDQLAYATGRAPRPREWYADPAGAVTAGWGLSLAAEDLAAIGETCRCGGTWRGRRIVSEAWIAEMLFPRQKLPPAFGGMHYGYLWYRPGKDSPVFAAMGDGGNLVYVNGETGISAGVTGVFKPFVFDRIEFLERHLLPALS